MIQEREYTNGGRTVLDRISSIIRREKYKIIPTLKQKQEIGSICVKVFFEGGKNSHLHKIKVVEKEGEFKVMRYPARFVPVMDAIIIKYFKEKIKQP